MLGIHLRRYRGLTHHVSPVRFLLAICVTGLGLMSFMSLSSLPLPRSTLSRSGPNSEDIKNHSLQSAESAKLSNSRTIAVTDSPLDDAAQYPGFLEEIATTSSTTADPVDERFLNWDRAPPFEAPVRPFIPVDSQSLPGSLPTQSQTKAVSGFQVQSVDLGFGQVQVPNSFVGQQYPSYPGSNGNDPGSQQGFVPATTTRPIIHQRLVHFDLKGAPLRLEYYKKVFPLLKKLGATGLLMEYEDMFPYWGKLKKVRALNAYSRNDIQEILRLASLNELHVIPLVQTFGHLEFVLKHGEYSNLREVHNFAQAICPSRNGSIDLVHDIIDQVLELHPNATYLHIGLDEVFQLGVCPVCTQRTGNTQTYFGNTDLFLSHVSAVVSYVLERHPGIRPIMWDDMFHSMAPQQIQLGLGELTSQIDVMIWSYFTDWTKHLPGNGNLYENVFENFWGATAFKGSDGETRQIPNVKVQADIHTSWLTALAYGGHKMKNFRGIALTGWSRYDHFYPLCELFPTSLPSLAINLQIMADAAFTVEGANLAFKHLGCTVFPQSTEFLTFDSQLTQMMSCDFPGVEVLRLAHMVDGTQKAVQEHLQELETKYPEYQMKQGFVQPSRIGEQMEKLKVFNETLLSYIPTAKAAFEGIFFDATLHEWIAAQIKPYVKKLSAWRGMFQSAAQMVAWPSRPLNVDVDYLLLDATATTLSPMIVAQNAFAIRTGQALPNPPKLDLISQLQYSTTPVTPAEVTKNQRLENPTSFTRRIFT